MVEGVGSEEEAEVEGTLEPGTLAGAARAP